MEKTNDFNDMVKEAVEEAKKFQQPKELTEKQKNFITDCFAAALGAQLGIFAALRLEYTQPAAIVPLMIDGFVKALLATVKDSVDTNEKKVSFAKATSGLVAITILKQMGVEKDD